MLKDDWLRGVKRAPEDFDKLVFMVMCMTPEKWWTVKKMSEYLRKFNGGMPVNVNRVLRSMKRLEWDNKIVLQHRYQGWFNWYEGRVDNG